MNKKPNYEALLEIATEIGRKKYGEEFLRLKGAVRLAYGLARLNGYETYLTHERDPNKLVLRIPKGRRILGEAGFRYFMFSFCFSARGEDGVFEGCSLPPQHLQFRFRGPFHDIRVESMDGKTLGHLTQLSGNPVNPLWMFIPKEEIPTNKDYRTPKAHPLAITAIKSAIGEFLQERGEK